jgi:hypothetical protein
LTENESHSQISKNKIFFASFLETGHRYQQKGNIADALAFFQMAANFAWKSHCGFFLSPELEKYCCETSHSLMPRNDHQEPEPTNNQGILHILSQAYTTGGHTRFVWRWIENDKQWKHSVLLVDQNQAPFPRELEELSSLSGGKLYRLPESKNLLERARAIVNLIDEVKPAKVVLHIHPYDVSTIVALNYLNQIPVIFLNHADHVFWAGSSVTNVIACIRESSQKLCSSRRGIPKEYCGILPIPLTREEERSFERQKLKTKLGVNGKTVLLSVASSYKFKPDGERDFCKSLLPLVKDIDCVLIAIGPSKEDEYWKHYSDVSKGKIMAIGLRTDVDNFYSITDIYLDSFPFGSSTSALDAAKMGIPVLSLTDPSTMLNNDDETFIKHKELSSSNISEWQQNAQLLLHDEELRTRLGKVLAEDVNHQHCTPGWLDYLEKIYEKSLLNTRLGWKGIPTKDSLTEHDLRLMLTHSRLPVQSIIDSYFLTFRYMTFRANLAFLLRHFPLFLCRTKDVAKHILAHCLSERSKAAIKRALRSLNSGDF